MCLQNMEIEGIRAFLEQNKDLLEELGPQVQKLNEIQAKVDEHEQQLGTLTKKVDNLEKKASGECVGCSWYFSWFTFRLDLKSHHWNTGVTHAALIIMNETGHNYKCLF